VLILRRALLVVWAAWWCVMSHWGRSLEPWLTLSESCIRCRAVLFGAWRNGHSLAAAGNAGRASPGLFGCACIARATI
jgi:hypothetical protein